MEGSIMNAENKDQEKPLSVYQKLAAIQDELKVPKGHSNQGKYDYRNLEDIERAIKPLTNAKKALCYLSYDIKQAGDRNYVVATATFICLESNEKIVTTGTAREPVINNAKMDGSQITGASSSYAGKYVLGGLFLIDDTEDADSYHDPNQQQETMRPQQKSKIQIMVAKVETNKKWISEEVLKELEELRNNLKQVAYMELAEKAIQEAGFAQSEAQGK